MATYSSILAWKIPETEKPGIYSQRGYKESGTSEHTHMSRHQWTRMSQSSVIATLQRELVNPKGTQEGEEYLLASSRGTTATPYGEPWGKEAQNVKNTGNARDSWDA